jgi:SAM-dependent MidA family methyltransferase
MNPLEAIIHDEIRNQEQISVARFMHLALYHPNWGYYAREEAVQNVGKKGDFITSVSTGPLFGKLLAQQFANWWTELGEPTSFDLVECGGLNGQLAFDILSALRSISPDCFSSTRYILIEPLERLIEHQRTKLKDFAQVSWIPSLEKLNHFQGILFGNELLDAFPVHLLERTKDEWKECFLRSENEILCWTHQSCPSSWTREFPKEAKGKIEVSPEISLWIQTATQALRKGYLLFLDYGWTDEEYFEVERPNGTLRAYRRHQLAEDILANAGEQDLTAHVRWTPILKKAKQLGLKMEEFIQQGRWLTRIVANHQLTLTPTEIRQFNMLTHPEFMGAPFRVLALKKD